jgi:hypothetical protein
MSLRLIAACILCAGLLAGCYTPSSMTPIVTSNDDDFAQARVNGA